MDANRFDSLTRSLTAPGSRRQAFRLLTGSVLVRLFPLGTVPTAAKKGRGGKDSRGKKKSNQDGKKGSKPERKNGAKRNDKVKAAKAAVPRVCQETCRENCRVCDPVAVPEAEEAVCKLNGRCFSECQRRCRSCSAGTSICTTWPEGTSACKDLASDPSNCGVCGVVCVGCEQCVSGVCTSTCDNLACQACVEGRCASTCSLETRCETCVDGACVGCQLPEACLPNVAQPGPGNVCLCPETLEKACGGACCAPTETCIDGGCVGCPSGQTQCGATCTDTATDPLNCGACGVACNPCQQCSGGSNPVCEDIPCEQPCEVCDPAIGGTCAPIKTCNAGQDLNLSTCECECQVSCPGGQVPNPEKNCECECTTGGEQCGTKCCQDGEFCSNPATSTCCRVCPGAVCTNGLSKEGCPVCRGAGEGCCCGKGQTGSPTCEGNVYTTPPGTVCCGGAGPCPFTYCCTTSKPRLEDLVCNPCNFPTS